MLAFYYFYQQETAHIVRKSTKKIKVLPFYKTDLLTDNNNVNGRD